MLRSIYSKKRIDQINISTLADDVVFALGDYLKSKEVNAEILELGIEFCEAILRGEKIKPDKMKINEMPDYERYKIIEKGVQELKPEGVDLKFLLKNTKEVKSKLDNIKNKIEVDSIKVKEIQKYFIVISSPFWKKDISSLRERKISRGLHINE